MKPKSPRSLDAIFQAQPSPLAHLICHARRLDRITKLLAALLPQPLAGHCRAGNVVGTSLVIVSDSPVWAARLRFLTTELLTRLNEERDLPPLTRLRIKVVPPLQEPGLSPRPRLGLSPKAGAVINDAADCINNPKLSSALRRLSRHAR
ncbi:MAG TPA: DUF721 domain-containing protein [Gammaproteobacteria bacterium]|nr:DUF721 domain-containing protein [Gammaproteobacteria bacterium]